MANDLAGKSFLMTKFPWYVASIRKSIFSPKDFMVKLRAYTQNMENGGNNQTIELGTEGEDLTLSDLRVLRRSGIGCVKPLRPVFHLYISGCFINPVLS